MTRALLLLPGLLLAGTLAFGATTTWASAQGEEDELPPCEWFIELAEDYPELEILACEGEWGAPVWADGGPYWEGIGLLSWDGKRVSFRGIAGRLYGEPEHKYVFEWSMNDIHLGDRSGACRAVFWWLREDASTNVRKYGATEEAFRELPTYSSIPACTAIGAAFNSVDHLSDYWWGYDPAPGVAWFVDGVLYGSEGDDAAVFRAVVRPDMLAPLRYWPGFNVEVMFVRRVEGELLVSYVAALDITSGDTGTGLAPPGYFIPEIALNAR